MARLSDFNYRRDSVLRDKEREPYNGYITATVPSIDRTPVVQWTFLNGKLKFGPVETGAGFIILCFLWLIFASVPERWVMMLCSLLQHLITTFLPLVCLVCVFYWAELLVQKYCNSRVSLVIFPICAVGEFCTQVLFDGSDILRASFLFTLILAGLVTATLSRLKLIPATVVLLLLTIARVSCWITLHEIHVWFRPFLAYFSAFSGLVLSRNVQTFFTSGPTEVESKVPIIRRTRRSSSVSSTSSHSSRRRTSLPALGIQSKGIVDQTTLGEAHGMITDLLADSNLAPNVASTLKLISTMIAPPTAFHTGPRPFIGQMTPLLERFQDESMADKVKDQPDLKEDVTLPMRLRRNLASGRRMSSTYTTTTSATGMPTVDPDMNILRTPTVSVSHDSLNMGAINSPKSPLTIDGSPSRNQDTFPKHRPAFFSHGFPSQNPGSTNLSRISPDRTNAPPSPNFGRKSPERPLPPSPNLIRRNSDKPNYMKHKTKDDFREPSERNDNDESRQNEKEKDGVAGKNDSACNCQCHGKTTTNTTETTDTNNSEKAHEDFELPQSEAQLSKLLDKINDWNFPIFDASKHGNVLVQVAYRVFQNVRFFETFKIPEKKFLTYFYALECGYHDIPYHNSIHACDVLQGVYYLTTAKIPGFCPPGARGKLESDSDCDSDSGITTVGMDASDVDEKKEDGEYGALIDAIPLLELLSLFTAAAMHDYDHPGRTNAFLVGTLSPQPIYVFLQPVVSVPNTLPISPQLISPQKSCSFMQWVLNYPVRENDTLALLYNDRSVLENHHAASAFALLMSDPKYNFLCELSSSDFKRFRFLAIEAILATDLKRHFDVLSDFNAKIAEGGINWDNEADRLLTLQCCIKMSDISGPSKRRDIHTLWTERIVEEFYEQGDEELSRGLPVSPYMDRNQPHVAQLQESFINHLVAPLYNSYSNAGLLPGTWVEVDSSSAETESEADDSNEDTSNVNEEAREKPKRKRKRKGKRRKVVSDLTSNIQRNYKMWRQKVKEAERELALIAKEDDTDKAEENEGEDDDDDNAVLISETPIHEDIIEEEENGSECSSTTDSRKEPDD